ncbi:MAG: primosomal protein N' [Anaerovoracaceae bacterium]
MKYVDLVIDNKNDNTDCFFTYGSEFDQVEKGQKVYVPFGKGNKIKAAYIFNVYDTLEKEIPGLKFVESIDQDVALTLEIIETCKFMKERYLCRYIDCINLFLPSGKKAKTRKTADPLKEVVGEKQNILKLTKEQETALGEITDAMGKNRSARFLLEGVTGSGKTEVYMRAISQALSMGKTAIMLVPEITLTKQIIDRFVERFGRDTLAVLHSSLTLGERYDEWQRISKGKARIVIGARSAVFAPIKDIGLIILDEEHETTYKSDMTPKYDTIEIAIKRAKAYNGCIVLGTATPSVVTSFRANQGIYQRLTLTERYNKVQLPNIEIVDMGDELRLGNRSVFSRRLYDEIKKTLEENKQVILFLNRRGFSTFVSCRDCGHVLKCDDCDISLTYHKGDSKLKCHYCGKAYDVPRLCPKCGSKYIRYFGTGTEKIAEEAEKLFGEYSIDRLELDTIKTKGSLNKILNNFAKGKTNILIGTQLVAKGLDFKNVGLVGIVAADVTLNIPDYRSAERTYQLITQVAGRAGRGDLVGQVVVQTYMKDNYAIKAACNKDYMDFYKKEIGYRQLMDYPPFGHLVQVSLISKETKNLNHVISIIRDFIDKNIDDGVVGIRNEIKEDTKVKRYKTYILIKCTIKEKNVVMTALKGIKADIVKKRYNISLTVDIDPYKIWRN